MEYESAVNLVTGLVCRIRHIAAEQVEPDADLPDVLGFDSLDAAELVAAIHRETGMEVAVNSFEDLRTIDKISRRMTDSRMVIS
jgi:acyl carrier protein